jgi:hypothetical protein
VATSDVIIWRIRVSCSISKATCTYVHTHTHIHRPICNTYCFPTVTMIRERASVLRYTYITCLVISLCNKYLLYEEMEGCQTCRMSGFRFQLSVLSVNGVHW